MDTALISSLLTFQFIRMGLDFENVIKLPKRQFINYAIGDPLPVL